MKFFSILAALPLALAAPVIRPRDAEIIPGKFIAVLKPQSGVNAMDVNSAASILGTAPDSQFSIDDFKGMVFSATDEEAENVANHADVSFT